MLEVPIEVTSRALAQWTAAGTVLEVANGFIVPNYIDAQESPQSDKQRQAESRARRRAARLRNDADPCHEPSREVTDGHAPSRRVTPSVPSVPSVPKDPVDERPPLELVPQPANEKPQRKKPEPSSDPRHRPLSDALCEAFAEIRGSRYPFTDRDAGSVKKLLKTGTDPKAIVEAWRRALRHPGYPMVSSLHELVDRLATFVGTGPPSTLQPKQSLPQPSSSFRTDGPITTTVRHTF